jgi:hypothetical protein
MKRVRSAAQIAASRRNGARSRGPKSEAAKAASSQNAAKHGLFRRRADGLVGSEDAGADPVRELELSAISGVDELGKETALTASRQLAEATALAHHLQARVTAALASEEPSAMLVDLLQQLARIARYQRRFRGQRDRALRGPGPPVPIGS